MNCPKCQAETPKDAQFCSACGAPLEPSLEKPETVEQPQPSPSFIKNFLSGFKEGLVARLKIAGIALAILALIGGGFFLKSVLEEKLTGPEQKTTTAAILPDQDNEVTLEKAKVVFPEGAVSKEAEIEITVIPAKEAPQPPTDNAFVGDIYDFETDAELASGEAAYLTLSYDPDELPSGTSEENLYLAHYNGNEWEPVVGAVIDPEAHTITAAVDDFSFFTVLVNLVKSVLEVDVIEAVDRFADLPDGIKQDLDRMYPQSAIRSGLHWKVSPLTRAASQTLLAANFVNQISGGVIAAIDGGEEAVADWIAEELAKKLGQDILADVAGEQAADITMAVYDTATLGKELYTEGFTAIKNTAMLKVKIVSWVLAREMEYINANVQEAYSKIATLNLWSQVTSDEPLEIYVIGIQGENKQTGFFETGLKFYYLNDQTGRWENYANGVFAPGIIEATISGKEVPTSEVPAATSGCQSVDLSDVSVYTVDKSGNNCSTWSISKGASKFEAACSEMSAQFRAHGVKEISTGGASTITIKADVTLSEPARLFPGGGVHYDDYVDLLVYPEIPSTLGNCGVSVTSDDDWGTTCFALNPDDAAKSGRASTALAHCGVPKDSTSATCSFEVQTGGRDKIYLVMAVRDAWAYAKVIGSFSNIQVCR